MKSYLWKEGEKVKVKQILDNRDEDVDDIGHKEEGCSKEFVESLLARPSVLTIPTWSVRRFFQ